MSTNGGDGTKTESHAAARTIATHDPAMLDAVERAAAMLGKRWKPALLCLLASGHHRYTALSRRLPGATPKMLTQQLRDLERDGLIRRIEHSGGARHVEYTLTPMGERLRPVVDALAAWGRAYEPPPRAPSGSRPFTGEREVARGAARPADARHA